MYRTYDNIIHHTGTVAEYDTVNHISTYIVSMLLLNCNTVISNANTSTIILFGDMQQDESSHHFVFHGRPAAPLISFFFVNSNKISP